MIWPALLMAADLELPERVFIHGYLLMDEHKMSKSLGNVLDPFEVMDVYGTDALRYYLLREVAFGQDGSISPEGFETRYNTELANEYGNLASRSLAMIGKYRDGVVPEAQAPPGAGGRVRRADRRGRENLDARRGERGAGAIWLRVRALNRFVQDQAPWKLAKDDDRADGSTRCSTAWPRGCGWSVVLLLPWLPETAEKLLAALGREDRSLDCAGLGGHGGGAAMGELGQLFPQHRAARGRRGLMVDTHCHLDSCKDDDGELIARARQVGVARSPRSGWTGRSIERALDAAARARGRRGDRRPPPAQERGLRRRATRRRSSGPLPTRWRARSARPASTTTATTRRARTSGARSRPSSTWPSALACRW